MESSQKHPKVNRSICRYCKKELLANHGNKKYHDTCSYSAKLERSRKQYWNNLSKYNPYYKNDRILKEFYFTYGEKTEIDPDLLENSGFDFNTIKKEKKYPDGRIIFELENFAFRILRHQKIVLWKL